MTETTIKTFTGHKNKIGIIDSGSGGLTVAKEIQRKHPTQDIHYYADHLYLPYGQKPLDFIARRVTEIAQYLLAENCTKIIFACHTASAQLATIDLGFSWSGVVIPTINGIRQLPKDSKIAIIGTTATINSGIYKNIGQQLATPKLADLIEAQNVPELKHEIAQIAETLGPIDHLILACTHYPLAIEHFACAMPNTKILNTPKLAANCLIIKPAQNLIGKVTIESSNPNDNFINIAQKLLGPINYFESVL